MKGDIVSDPRNTSVIVRGEVVSQLVDIAPVMIDPVLLETVPVFVAPVPVFVAPVPVFVAPVPVFVAPVCVVFVIFPGVPTYPVNNPVDSVLSLRSFSERISDAL